MNVTLQLVYCRQIWNGGKAGGSFCSTDLGKVMMLDRSIYWETNGTLQYEAKSPDTYLSVEKQWAVMINNEIFRLCARKVEAEKEKNKVINTMKQIEDLGEEEDLSFANLFELKEEYQKVERGYKRVKLD